MRNHLIRNNNHYLDYLMSNNLIIKTSDSEFITFIYHTDNTINSLLNKAIYDKIKITKQKSNIIIKINTNTLNNIYDYKINEELDKNISKLINLVSISNSLKITIKKTNEDYNIKLYTNNYRNILDSYSTKYNNYYQIKINLIDDIYENIAKYNSLMEISNQQINEIVEDFDFVDIKHYYNIEEKNKIIIINEDNKRRLIISGIVNISFDFLNIDLFDKVFLPEILKIYVSKNNNITNEKITTQFKNAFYHANDNLYILDFDENLVKANVTFLHNLIDKKQYRININKDYMIRETEDIEIIEKTPTKAYSYGYINILLISFILSIITLVICLLNR